MQFEAALARAVTGDERRPFGLGLLDAILAEHALAGGDDRLDRLGAEGFGDRDQRDRRGVAPGIAASRRDLLAHRGNALRSIHGFHLVNARSKTIQILAKRRRPLLREFRTVELGVEGARCWTIKQRRASRRRGGASLF